MKTKILLVIAFAAMVQFSMQDVVTTRPAAVAAPFVTAPATTAWPWRGEWGNGWWPGDRNGDGVVDWRDSWAWGGARGDWDPAWGWTGGNWDPAWGSGGWTGGAWDPAWNGRYDTAWGTKSLFYNKTIELKIFIILKYLIIFLSILIYITSSSHNFIYNYTKVYLIFVLQLFILNFLFN